MILDTHSDGVPKSVQLALEQVSSMRGITVQLGLEWVSSLPRIPHRTTLHRSKYLNNVPNLQIYEFPNAYITARLFWDTEACRWMFGLQHRATACSWN